MSSAFAIAAVTAVLKDLLNNGLVDHDLSAVGNVTVTALPPDRIATGNTDEHSQINLFMFHVTPNIGWRNIGLPSRDENGARLTNLPLALDLHYLITAYGAEEFHAEVLLGYAMQLLHETPLLTRQMIKQTLKPTLPAGVTVPPGIKMLSTSDLAEQVELIKIYPETLTTEEISRLWTAIQARYRPTAAYQISVVLIQKTEPIRSVLPVLTIGPQDQGPVVYAHLNPPFPTLDHIDLPRNQASALMNDQVTLVGDFLAGEKGDPTLVTVSVRLSTDRLDNAIQFDVPVNQRTNQSIQFTIPNQANVFYPAGFYRVSVQVASNANPVEVQESNELPLQIAPRITEINGTSLPMPPNPPISVARTNGDVTITIKCEPEVLPEQNVSLIIDSHEVIADVHSAQTDTLTFKIKAIDAGTYRLRLRVDGVDSLLIDRSNVSLPKFDDSQQVILT
jgi:Pvc16 N-terminal domain